MLPTININQTKTEILENLYVCDELIEAKRAAALGDGVCV